MIGFQFSRFIPNQQSSSKFDELLNIFTQLLNITSGNVSASLNYLSEIDRKYQLTSKSYGIGDFIEELKQKGFIKQDPVQGSFSMTGKTEQTIRRQSLEEIFGKLKKGKAGNHNIPHTGKGEEFTAEWREYRFGDTPDQIDMTGSIQNAQINHGVEDFTIAENDLSIQEKDTKAITSTVLMIDISHSMVLYGEDRITPAKKVAMGLAELILTKYPKDTLDIIVFGDDARPIQVKDLPYLQAGPFHTNTVAGLDLAMDILRRRKTNNKQIFMITDGKPTCLKEGIKYYKNSFGLDSKIVNKTLDRAANCKKHGISITTFMIAKDPYLQRFVREFTLVNNGRAFYSSLTGLGTYIFEDYIRNRRKYVR